MKKFKEQVRVLRIFFVIFIFGVFLAFFSWWQIGLKPVDPENIKKVTFTITKGEGFSEISEKLKGQGLIRDSLHFKILAISLGIAAKIQAGNFFLSPSMDSLSIAKSLIKGGNDQWVTIVEGLREEEIIRLLRAQGFPVNISQWEKEIKTQNLEGKLFPDSYLIPQDSSEGAILNILYKNFQKKVLVGLEPELGKSDLTLSQILIFASIVEREVKTEEDRRIVAGILLKRWQANWPLQADATVQYALANPLDWWPKKLSSSHLKIKSAYNTYLYRGLPPRPICNPGLSSVKAVLNPEDSPFWFYLHGNDGKTYYAKTANEHAENIRNYLTY